MRRATFPSLVLIAISTSSALLAQERPQYPEGSAVPRYATEAERDWMRNNPIVLPEAVTPPPQGQVTCVAEYEPMDGIIIAWEGLASWTTILTQMASHITTTGDADVYVSVDSAGEQNSAFTKLQNGGVDMSRVNFIITPTDSIWMRDYGPRYVYQGNCRAIIDHTYNVPRPLDNMFNTAFGQFTGHLKYELPLRHGGGNYHLDALGQGRTTRLIVNENPQFTESEIDGIWNDYQNLDTTFYQPFPRSVDATQHIDMWMQVIADDVVIISDWPFNQGSTQDQICDSTATSMANEGYTVFRVPARSVGGTHYTYTNVVMCNDIVLIPTYTNGQVTQHNTPALQAWQAAAPNKTIIQINCENIVWAAGVMHCIVQHLPEFKGTTDPLAYVAYPNGGEILQPGSNVEIIFATDDDEFVQDVDILLSTDGGATFPTVLASGIANAGGWVWNVPDLCTGLAVVRVVARDANGNTGGDNSDLHFAINGTGCSAQNTSYGAASPGQLGAPTLSATSPVIGGPLDITVDNAWPGATAVLVYGGGPASVPLGGATLLVQYAGQAALGISGVGDATLSLQIPQEVAYAGGSLFWQGWVFGDPAGIATTDGLETRFGF